MTYLIKINRETFKRNPRAGENQSRSPDIFSVTVETKTGECWQSVGMLNVNMQPAAITGEFALVESSGSGILVGTVERRTFSPVTDRMQPHNAAVVYNHLPEPNWSYRYVDTKVKCDECGAEFSYTELVYEDEEYHAVNACPKCGESDCCELEFENPEAVAKELGLR